MTEQLCVCRKPRIDLTGRCTVCGLERLHVTAKTPPVPPVSDTDEREAA